MVKMVKIVSHFLNMTIWQNIRAHLNEKTVILSYIILSIVEDELDLS